MATAMYVKIEELPIVNKVLARYGYQKASRTEDRYLMNILNRRNINICIIEREIVEAVRASRNEARRK